jgi:hypothetical protein
MSYLLEDHRVVQISMLAFLPISKYSLVISRNLVQLFGEPQIPPFAERKQSGVEFFGKTSYNCYRWANKKFTPANIKDYLFRKETMSENYKQLKIAQDKLILADDDFKGYSGTKYPYQYPNIGVF